MACGCWVFLSVSWVWFSSQALAGKRSFRSDVLMVSGTLTAHYDNVGVFSLVEAESAQGVFMLASAIKQPYTRCGVVSGVL